MLEGTEVAYLKFKTNKKNKDFIYEIRLLFLSLTSEYKLERRWYFEENPQVEWRTSREWNLGDKDHFQKKVIQKRDINKWTVVEQRLDQSFELLKRNG